MKQILVALLITPAISFAQTTQPPKSNGSIVEISADQIVLNGPVSVDVNDIIEDNNIGMQLKGNAKFKIGKSVIQSQEAIISDKKANVSASKVSITCLNFPKLVGNSFSYNQANKVGVLTGNIIIYQNNTEKYLGETMTLDFSQQQFVVKSLN